LREAGAAAPPHSAIAYRNDVAVRARTRFWGENVYQSRLPSSQPEKPDGSAKAAPSLRDASERPELDTDTRKALLAAIPHLRAFAISLTGSVERADDLVQDTVVRALDFIDRFEPGTNLQAWMFTILRNQFHSAYRKRKREVEDADGLFAAKLTTMPDQDAHLEFDDFHSALAQISPDQREAILLIGAEGFTYEEAAMICATKVGTIKSRVNRARTRLSEILGYDEVADIGPDRIVQAAVGTE
jgi:RNA polymerase sigma-70 factor, ECF subfamily